MKIFKIVLYVLGGLVALFLGVALFLPAQYEVTRSTDIKVPASEVYPKISDLNKWLSWNPWSRQEPAAKNTLTGEAGKTGQRWAWAGKVLGKGSMTLQEASEKSVAYLLKFEEPMQSEATNVLTLVEKGNSTQVSWKMKGSLDYPMGRYMGFFMDGMLGKDFEDGLRNLKEELEKK